MDERIRPVTAYPIDGRSLGYWQRTAPTMNPSLRGLTSRRSIAFDNVHVSKRPNCSRHSREGKVSCISGGTATADVSPAAAQCGPRVYLIREDGREESSVRMIFRTKSVGPMHSVKLRGAKPPDRVRWEVAIQAAGTAGATSTSSPFPVSGE